VTPLCAFALVELFLFKRLSILLVACENPFVWWHNHEGQFSNVPFMTKYILGIPRS